MESAAALEKSAMPIAQKTIIHNILKIVNLYVSEESWKRTVDPSEVNFTLANLG